MRPCPYLNTVFEYIHANVPRGQRIHVYGPALAVMRAYFPRLCRRFDVSADSTKWTRAVNSRFKRGNGACCRKHNRDAYFSAYVAGIQKMGIEVLS